MFQLQNYGAGLAQVAGRNPDLAVVDLSRDGTDFTRADLAPLQDRGQRVLAYFEVGSMENYRPEHAAADAGGLLLGEVEGWPEERYGRFWEERWWQLVVRPRLDQALNAGFDGCYLDETVAYGEIEAGTDGLSREQLAQRMAALIARLSQYAKAKRPGFLVVPQNSPELRTQPGYLAAIDGIGQESLFYHHDGACTQAWCAENLAHVRAIQAAGKFVLAIDYPSDDEQSKDACRRDREYGFAGFLGNRELNARGRSC